MVSALYILSRRLARSLGQQLRQQRISSYIASPSRFSAASVGFAAAGIPFITIDSQPGFPRSSLSPSHVQGEKSQNADTFSIRDISQGAAESIAGAYTKTRHWLRKQFDKEGEATVTALTALNVSIYLLWKGAPTSFMVRHFANSLESMRSGRVWTSVTSNFSHIGAFHLAANMFLLNRFGPEVAEILGKERFYVFYGIAGVASSLASLSFRRLTRSSTMSLGASGAVVGILWLYACFFPERRMALFGSEKTLTMQELVMAYMVVDAAGLLGSFGKIDFAAHLGGAIFANFWFYLIRDKLVREQEARRRNHQAQGFLHRYVSTKSGE